MAKAIRNVETVERVNGITLELSPEEAVHLFLILGRVVGNDNKIRKSCHNTWDTLCKVLPHIVSDFYGRITEDLVRIRELDEATIAKLDQYITKVKIG